MNAPKRARCSTILVASLLATVVFVAPARAEEDDAPYYLADRGTGLPTSLFGTYVRKGEWLVYVFYEYTKNTAEEYKPNEVGYEGGTDYKGTLTEHEGLLFVSYGITDWLMFELEPAVWTKATLTRADEDVSAVPDRIEESGLGDVDMQLRWRYMKETERRPELFGYLEITPGIQSDKVLIGTQDTEYSLGVGVIKGLHWGTLTGRASFRYSTAAGEGGEFSEYALEYLKRLSDRFRVVATVEGEQEDFSLIGELQWHVNRHVMLKFNSGFGLAEKAPDIAPEVGVLFSF